MSIGRAPEAAQLSDYTVLLRRHWGVVVLTVVVSLALASAYLVVAPREYTSRTSVLVTATSPEGTASGSRPVEINLDTEAQLLTSTDTVTAAAELLDLSTGELGDLAERVSVTVPPNTDILTIAFVAGSRAAAREGAEAFADAYLGVRRATAEEALDAQFTALQDRVGAVTAQIEQVTAAGEDLPEGSAQRLRNDERLVNLAAALAALNSQQNQVRATPVTPGRVITQATSPASPSSPDVVLGLAAGLLLGLLAGLALAALRYRADDCLRTADDVLRRTGLPVVAALADRLDERDVSLTSSSDADTRAYGRLRNVVTAGLEGNRRPAVVVAGVRRGGGPVAANLAASLARLGEDVYLVCADVYAGTAVDLLGAAPAVGLAEVLGGEQPVGRAARPVPGLATLRVLGPGADAQRADALLQTSRLRALIDALAATAAYVVVEAPPTAVSPVAQALAPVAETAVLVVEQAATTAREVSDAQEQFAAMRRQVLGVVLAGYRAEGDPAARARVTGLDADPDRAGRRNGQPATGPARADRDPALR